MQLKYLEDMAFVHPSRIVDMDGIHYNPKDYLERYGWTSMGQEAYALQLIIRGNMYSAHAALTEDGFIAWQIFEGPVSSHSVACFIKNKLAPVFYDTNILILDNASNQKSRCVRDCLEVSLHGRFKYCSPYSPELKPIERAFSLVRRYVRENEFDSRRDLNLINDAFYLYSVYGDRGSHCYHLFDLYRNNHDLWVQDQMPT